MNLRPQDLQGPNPIGRSAALEQVMESIDRQAEIALFEYINGFYNPRRRH